MIETLNFKILNTGIKANLQFDEMIHPKRTLDRQLS